MSVWVHTDSDWVLRSSNGAELVIHSFSCEENVKSSQRNTEVNLGGQYPHLFPGRGLHLVSQQKYDNWTEKVPDFWRKLHEENLYLSYPHSSPNPWASSDLSTEKDNELKRFWIPEGSCTKKTSIQVTEEEFEILTKPNSISSRPSSTISMLSTTVITRSYHVRINYTTCLFFITYFTNKVTGVEKE